MEENEVIIVDDILDLKGAPHTVCEIARESLSTVSEKTEEELYAQPSVPETEEPANPPEEVNGTNPDEIVGDD